MCRCVGCKAFRRFLIQSFLDLWILCFLSFSFFLSLGLAEELDFVSGVFLSRCRELIIDAELGFCL